MCIGERALDQGGDYRRVDSAGESEDDAPGARRLGLIAQPAGKVVDDPG